MPDEEIITNVGDFQRRYLSSDRRLYPVRLDIQLTQDEATSILNWIRAKRVHDYRSSAQKQVPGAH